VSFASGTMNVLLDGGDVTPDTVIDTVARAGYLARLRTTEIPVLRQQWWKSRRVAETLIGLLLWCVAFGIERLTDLPPASSRTLYLAAMAVAGYPVFRAASFALRNRRADMNLLMSIAAVGAIAIGEWEEGSSVLILFSIGLMLQSLTLARTRQAVQTLMALAPQEASVLRNGRELRVAVDAVQVGETVVIRPGERVAVDGTLIEGESRVDQSPITGESVPVEVAPGSNLFAGSINGDGLIVIRSSKAASDSALARIIHMVEEAQDSRAPAQAFVDRFAAIYTPVVVLIALIVATIVPVFVGDFRDWAFRALVLLVVACPCALVISTPVALVSAIGSASRRGVLFKGGSAIEALASVRTVAFDKTGTLTVGRPVVVSVAPVAGVADTEVLALAAGVESGSSHPIALGIVRAARERDLPIPASQSAKGIPGRGASAAIGGETIMVGSRRLFSHLPPAVEQAALTAEGVGQTVVIVSKGDTILGVIALADQLRPTAPAVVSALRDLKLRLVMLTGDNRLAAHRIAEAAGVDDVRSELLPEDKVAAIRELQSQSPVAMVGDGVNDAPALATASVGVAMGVTGADVAIEAADVALMADDLDQLPAAIGLARRTIRIIQENIAASILVKAAFLLLTVAGITNLWLAVIADVGMSLAVTLNSLRLIRGQPGEAND
jgi:Cd2+/Zn2+-exporting ATPase